MMNWEIVIKRLHNDIRLNSKICIMNKAAIEEKVKSILEAYGLNSGQLESNASFINDLGLDSLEIAELILTAEHSFDISISFEYDGIDTISDLVNTIEGILTSSLSNKSQYGNRS